MSNIFVHETLICYCLLILTLIINTYENEYLKGILTIFEEKNNLENIMIFCFLQTGQYST